MAVGLSIDGATDVVCAQHRVQEQEAGGADPKASNAVGTGGSFLQVTKCREAEVALAQGIPVRQLGLH